MQDNLIMFSSVTLAMKSRELLKQNKIMSNLVRTPIQLRTKSCGYSLYIPKDFKKAYELIGSRGIPTLGTSAVGGK